MVAHQIEKDLKNASWIRKMFEEGNRLRALYGAEDVYDFSLGNPDSDPPEAVLKAMERHIRGKAAHQYMPNAGFPDVRQKIAEKVSRGLPFPLDMHHIVMTVGAAGGMNAALKALLDPGDEVIVLAPYFAEYLFYIRNHGGVPVVVSTDPDTFEPDAAAVAAAVTPRTKALILNNPNNPTGVVYSRTALHALADALPETVCVLSDEPYSRLVYDDVEVPAVLGIFENALIIDSFSKSLALPGERIGYIAVSPRCRDAELLIAALSFTNRVLGFVNAPSLMQRAVADALDAAVDTGVYRERRDALHAIVTEAGFLCPMPMGAFYLFPRSPIPDDIAFVQKAAQHHILAVPGSGFGAPGYFRLAYCTGLDVIQRSRDAFLRLGAEYRK